jgi:hypothetical protein
MSDPSDESVEAPGWSAIDAAVTRHYPDQIPHQFTSQVAYDLEQGSPLPAVCVWEALSPPSWHFVGYGLSELFEKDSPIPDVSGFGIELTLRTPRGDGAEHPPVWGVKLIQALAHHCFRNRGGFDTGHCVDLGGSITPDGSSALTGLVFVPDAMFRRISTPHGSVLFLQAVGLTADELAIFQEMSQEARVMAIADLDPSGLTDPWRESWTADSELSKVLQRYRLGIGV